MLPLLSLPFPIDYPSEFTNMLNYKVVWFCRWIHGPHCSFCHRMVLPVLNNLDCCCKLEVFLYRVRNRDGLSYTLQYFYSRLHLSSFTLSSSTLSSFTLSSLCLNYFCLTKCYHLLHRFKISWLREADIAKLQYCRSYLQKDRPLKLVMEKWYICVHKIVFFMDVFMEKYYPFITRECEGERERVSSHRKSILNSLNLKTSFICLNVLCTPAFFCVYCQLLIKFYFLFARPHLWDLIYCVTAFFPIRTVFFFKFECDILSPS